MYEDQTYDAIMARLLAAIPDTLDKREGSFIWDALSPAALELAQAYIDLEIEHQQTFAGSASGNNLEQRTAEMGVNRLPASYAKGLVTFTGSETTVIPAGSIVATQSGIQFQTDIEATIDASGTAEIPVTAVIGGIAGNVPANTIIVIPVSIAGVTAVINSASTYGGEQEENDEALRYRYFDEITHGAIDGNIAQYQKWAREYPGIGRAKIFPLWNGANTVKVSILDSDNHVAGAGLIADFQEYLDPESQGIGNGVAPIGAIITVSTATAVNIKITADIVLAEGYSEASGIDDILTVYLAELAYTKNTVTYIGIGAAILTTPCVDQVQNLLINEAAADVILTAEQIPMLGTTTWTVVSP